MKLRIEKSVTVITPTIGSDKLIDAAVSVESQTYKNIKHLIVVDGPEHLNKVLEFDRMLPHERRQIAVTPENTGANGFYGHRIYAGYPHLINSDYIAFLDEDNWYGWDHIQSLVETIESKKLDWAYSLRKIYTKDKYYVADDNCESLGRWPIHWSIGKEEQYLIDTSSYLFKREFLTQVCNHWHHGWGGDRRFYHIISKVLNHQNYDTTGKHTLSYRLDDAIEKKYGNISFFTDGNEVVKNHNGGTYPWEKI